MTPQQPPTPAPRRSGCVIVLLVIGGLLNLVCVGSGIAVFVAARSDAGKKIFSAIDQGVKLAEEGVNAPGAAELRAAGCPQAIVLDMSEAVKIAGAFIDGGLGTVHNEYPSIQEKWPDTAFGGLRAARQQVTKYLRIESSLPLKQSNGGTRGVVLADHPEEF